VPLRTLTVSDKHKREKGKREKGKKKGFHAEARRRGERKKEREKTIGPINPKNGG